MRYVDGIRSYSGICRSTFGFSWIGFSWIGFSWIGCVVLQLLIHTSSALFLNKLSMSENDLETRKEFSTHQETFSFEKTNPEMRQAVTEMEIVIFVNKISPIRSDSSLSNDTRSHAQSVISRSNWKNSKNELPSATEPLHHPVGLIQPMLPIAYHRRLPHAIIIGVKKGGTRALLEFLKIHPDVKARGPESHFFDKNFHRGFEWYRRQMPVTHGNQITLEKTPSYFITDDVPERVRMMSSGIRLIIVVRDPVTRAVSDYAQAMTKRPERGPFERLAFLSVGSNTSRLNSTSYGVGRHGTMVDASWGPIRIGLYAHHLKRWMEQFPLSQMHFVSGENLVRNPAEELIKVERFLGLRPRIGYSDFLLNTTKGFPCIRKADGTSIKTRCLGKTKGRMHPSVEPAALRRLAEFYQPFNQKFYELTGIDFGWM